MSKLQTPLRSPARELWEEGGIHRSKRRQFRRTREIALRPRAVLLAFLDANLAFVAVAIACRLNPWLTGASTPPHVLGFDQLWLPAILSSVALAQVLGLHDPRRILEGRRMLKQGVLLSVLSTVVMVGWLYVYRYQLVGRVLAGSFALLLFGLYIISRLLVLRMLGKSGPVRCLVGDESVLFRINSILADHGHRSASSLPIVFDPMDSENLCEYVEQHHVDELIVDSRDFRIDDEDLLSLTLLGVRIMTIGDYFAEQFGFVPVGIMGADWLCYSIETSRPYYASTKRVADVGLSLVGLMIGMPICLVAAICIRLEGKGPIFYSQTRLGRFNAPFRIHKLRTMQVDAESSGARWASKNDQRITRVGRFLRLTRIDEIPQFWNVLKGEMAIVGPRPERPEFAAELEQQFPLFMQRHLVAPGITGWAQINYSYAGTPAESEMKLMYDLYYVKRASVLLDLHIMCRTITALMQGAR